MTRNLPDRGLHLLLCFDGNADGVPDVSWLDSVEVLVEYP